MLIRYSIKLFNLGNTSTSNFNLLVEAVGGYVYELEDYFGLDDR